MSRSSGGRMIALLCMGLLAVVVVSAIMNSISTLWIRRDTYEQITHSAERADREKEMYSHSHVDVRRWRENGASEMERKQMIAKLTHGAASAYTVRNRTKEEIFQVLYDYVASRMLDYSRNESMHMLFRTDYCDKAVLPRNFTSVISAREIAEFVMRDLEQRDGVLKSTISHLKRRNNGQLFWVCVYDTLGDLSDEECCQGLLRQSSSKALEGSYSDDNSRKTEKEKPWWEYVVHKAFPRMTPDNERYTVMHWGLIDGKQ